MAEPTDRILKLVMGHTSPQSIEDTSGHTFAISKEKA